MTFYQRDKLANIMLDGHGIRSRAIAQFGKEAQCRKAVEECAELIVALSHRDRLRPFAIVEECADVFIMALQVAEMYGVDEFIEAVEGKHMRLAERLRK